MRQLESCEIEGGYRKLCGALLVHAALSLSTRGSRRGDSYGNELSRQKDAADEWLDGGVGRITFEEACEAVDMDSDYVRTAMDKYLSSPQRFRKKPWMRRNGGATSFVPINPVKPESSPSS